MQNCVFIIPLFASIIYTTYTEKIWKDTEILTMFISDGWNYRVQLSSFITFYIFLYSHDYMILF